jgi:hypothetical protein
MELSLHSLDRRARCNVCGHLTLHRYQRQTWFDTLMGLACLFSCGLALPLVIPAWILFRLFGKHHRCQQCGTRKWCPSFTH